MATTYASPNEAELTWLRSSLDKVRAFVDANSAGDRGKPVTLEALDRAFASRLGNTTSSWEANDVINVVGHKFGQFLVDDAGFQWTVATDEHGTELAVRALPGTADVLVYPANFVAKRWERRETGFLVSTFSTMRRDVEDIATKAAGAARAKPWWKPW